MADKETPSEEKEVRTVKDVKETKTIVAPGTHELSVTQEIDKKEKRRQSWIIWSIVGCVVVLGAILVIAGVFVNAARNQLTTRAGLQPTQTTQRRGFGGGPGYAGGSFYRSSASTDGPTTTTTTTKYTYTQGVVTQVNSDNIVVAGNGKSQTIKTNSSTTYDNSTKPAVNDTVTIVGTADSSNNVTATEIAVNNG